MRIAIPCLAALVGLAAAGCASIAPSDDAGSGQPVFTCKTEVGTFRVAPSADETFSLQMPDGQVQNGGSEEIEGSSVCAYSIWTFKGDASEYVLSEIGCYPDDNQPPARSTGRLEIKGQGSYAKSYWCY